MSPPMHRHYYHHHEFIHAKYIYEIPAIFLSLTENTRRVTYLLETNDLTPSGRGSFSTIQKFDHVTVYGRCQNGRIFTLP